MTREVAAVLIAYVIPAAVVGLIVLVFRWTGRG